MDCLECEETVFGCQAGGRFFVLGGGRPALIIVGESLSPLFVPHTETLAPELIAEPTTTLSAYELERGKPMPGQNHSIVQLNLGFELKTHYREQFRFMSEVNVEVAGKVLVPDIGIFEKIPIYMTHDVRVIN